MTMHGTKLRRRHTRVFPASYKAFSITLLLSFKSVRGNHALTVSAFLSAFLRVAQMCTALLIILQLSSSMFVGHGLWT